MGRAGLPNNDGGIEAADEREPVDIDVKAEAR